MRKLGVLLMCVLLVGLTTSAFAELKSVEVGGSVRVRGTWIGAPGFDNDNPDVDVVQQRTRLNATATFTEDVMAFIELQMSSMWGYDGDSGAWGAAGREGAPSDLLCDDGYYYGKNAGMYNGWIGQLGTEDEQVNVYQAYIQANDMLGYPVSMKVGRQEMSYGTELLIGDLDFFQYGLSFDAVKLMYADQDLAIDMWWSKLVENITGPAWNPETDCDTDFYGIYGTYSGVEDMVIDAYLLYLRQAANWSNGFVETDGQYTLGARVAGLLAWIEGMEYNVEAAYQFGEDGMDNDYDAWMVDLLLSYAIEAEYDPTVFFGYTFSTGDGDPDDNDNETFMFPFTDYHSRWGYADLVGLGNLNVFKLGMTACPAEDWLLATQIVWMLTHEEEQIPPSLGGGYTNATNDDSIGQEFDISMVYNYTEDLQFELTYGHVFVDDWLDDVSGDDADDADLVYAQAKVSF